MKKSLTLLLAVSILAGSSFNVLANETEAIPSFPEETVNTTEIPTPTIHKQKEVILQLNNTLALVDGKDHRLETVPKVIEGSTYLPLRFMADQLLEAQVDWDATEKKVTINKDDTKIEVKIDSKKAHINGDQIEIANPAIIDQNTTYLPLRTMADLFEIQINFDQVTKKITLIKEERIEPVEPLVKKPIAQFKFDQSEYTAGQTVWAVDESFHMDGEKITNQLWMIDFNEKQTHKHLENMFSKPRAGTYSVSLKVEAGKDNWSEWTTRQITINPNHKPLITSLETSKDSYAGGEPIEFSHTYDNESWEEITAERWKYRQSWEDNNKTVIDKPQAIFDEGHYIVTLQLQDAYGNWSDAKEVTVHINNDSKQSELEYRFTKGKPGDIIDNFSNFNYNNYTQLRPKERNLGTGTLFMSNSPENVKHNGILYRDHIEGNGRILLHHHNSFTPEENQKEAKKVIMVAENTTSQPVSFTISNKVEKGPSTDILFVGQQLLYDYLKGAPGKEYSLNPGEKVTIYDSSNKKWESGQLVSAQMDVHTSGRVKFTVASMAKDAKIDQLDRLPELQRDAHPRGTFYQKDLDYKIFLEDKEPTRLVLGAGAEEWVMGYDIMTGNIVQNKGNFAVNYSIEITAKEEDMGVMLNPRAGVFRGAVKWDNEQPFLAPSKGYFMGHNSKAVMLGVVKAGETRTLKYSLPNGSASPVLIVFVPESLW